MLDIPDGLASAPGAQELRDWFGYWPSFHDAKLLKIDVSRSHTPSLFLHTWEMTKNVDEQGFYVLTKHAVVEIALTGVSDSDFQGLDYPNVILRLAFEKTNKGFRLDLDDCCGFSGTIDAKDIAFRPTPGEPSEHSTKRNMQA